MKDNLSVASGAEAVSECSCAGCQYLRQRQARDRSDALRMSQAAADIAQPVSPPAPKRWKTKVHTDKFIATMGYELTALVPGYEEVLNYFGRSDTTSETDNRTLDIGSRVRMKLKNALHSYNGNQTTDGHCIELPSPVCKTWAEARSYYKLVWKLLRAERCRPKNWQTVCGGSHIHFGLNDIDKIAHVMRAGATAYFLPWVFTQPDDTDSCDNIIASAALNDGKNGARYNPSAGGSRWMQSALLDCAPRTKTNLGEHDWLWGSKQYSVVCNKPGPALTLEYRCVENPKNLSEFKLQVKFFNRFTRWALNNESPAVVPITGEELNKITKEKALADFKALLKKLGLPYRPYAKFVKRNLFPRWELGRERV